jgi:hypothetical protein
LAYGHFEVDGKVKPDQQDYQGYPETRFVYVVRSSELYCKPVRLSELGIRVGRFGKPITAAQFNEIKNAAAEMEEHHQ